MLAKKSIFNPHRIVKYIRLAESSVAVGLKYKKINMFVYLIKFLCLSFRSLFQTFFNDLNYSKSTCELYMNIVLMLMP